MPTSVNINQNKIVNHFREITGFSLNVKHVCLKEKLVESDNSIIHDYRRKSTFLNLCDIKITIF